jgi:hypothetical protein
VAVEVAAETMHEGDGAEAGVRRRAGAALPHTIMQTTIWNQHQMQLY